MHRCLFVLVTLLVSGAATTAWGVTALPAAVGSVLCSSNNPSETLTDLSSCALGGGSASVGNSDPRSPADVPMEVARGPTSMAR